MNARIVSAEFLSSNELPDEALLREHLSNDMLCSKGTMFTRDDHGHLVFALPPSTMHWSRVWEWPWAVGIVPLAGKSVFNAGGGHSVMTCSLAKRARWVVVGDLDEGSLDHIRKQRPFSDCGNISAVKADLTNLSRWQPNEFDTVYCISVLEHIPQWLEALGWMLHVLKPGGRLVLTCDCEIVPGPNHKGRLEDCRDWLFQGMAVELLRGLGVQPDPSQGMVGMVEGKLYMILAVVLEKLS